MGCFSLELLETLLVDLVIICAIVAIIKLFIPWVTGQFPIVGQVLTIVLYAVVAIFAIYIIFGLLECLMGGGGLHLIPHR